VVRELDEKDIDDLYAFRLCIESYAIGHLARHATPKDIIALRRRVDAMRPLAKRERLIDLFEVLLQFHALLCELSGNKRIARAFDDIALEMRQILAIVGVGYDDPASIIALQVPIVDVIEQHDEKRALKHIRDYIEFACREAKELYHSRESTPT
jgi:DNA-binding GntR family transcriptional regulator